MIHNVSQEAAYERTFKLLCPYCGHLVAPKGKKCPSCGQRIVFDVGGQMTWLPATQGVSENPGIGKKILGGTLVALGLGGLLWFLTRKAEAANGTNGTCSSDADCPSGMVCQGGICVLESGPDGNGNTVPMRNCEFENKQIPESQWTSARCEKKWCQNKAKYVRASEWSEANCSIKIGWVLWKTKPKGTGEWRDHSVTKKNGWFEVRTNSSIYTNITTRKRDSSPIFKGTILSPTGKAPRTDELHGSHLDYHWIEVVLP
jgi:hypothetical protein